jgi:ABC-type bacteriocin/lantibiotic exporter with double-glycine peptidase domain
MKFLVKKTPIRLQIDPIECGAVCLGIILEHFGTFVPGERLRKLAQVSLTGASAKGIMDAAKTLNLSASAQKILASDIKNLSAPAILFFDQCHFVVFEGYRFGRFYINDPSLGRYGLTEQAFQRRFSRVAITIAQTKVRAKDQSPKILSPKILFISLGLFSGLLFASISAFLSLMLSGGEGFFSPLLIFGSLSILLGLICFAQVVFLKALLNLTKNHESKDLLESLKKVPHDFFNKLPFNSFAQSFRNIFLMMSEQAKKEARYFFCAFLAVLLLAIGLISHKFLLVFLAVLVIFWPFFKKRAPFEKPMNRFFTPDLVAMGQEELVLDGLMKQELSNFTRYPKPFFLIVVPFILVLSFAFLVGQAWPLGEITFAEIFSVEILALGALWSLGNLFIEENRASADLATLKREIAFAKKTDNPNKIALPAGIFAVVAAGHQVFSLRDLLDLKEEQRIGLINDDSDLFLGTLKDNLSLFLDVKEQDLVKALELACATDLFYNRPLGLLFPIWAQGKNLSLSEKKRLLLAQALIHKPEVLLLEDFFGTLDDDTALRIIDNLKALNITTVFTSFRQKELMAAQRIIFIDETSKTIIDDHEALLKNQAFRSLSQ